MSFVYEVNLEVKAHRTQEFADWLGSHIQEMLTFSGFLNATWYTRKPEDEANQQTVTLWTIHYHLESAASYQNYVDTHATRMRTEGVSLFGDDFSASRRLLYQQQTFTR